MNAQGALVIAPYLSLAPCLPCVHFRAPEDDHEDARFFRCLQPDDENAPPRYFTQEADSKETFELNNILFGSRHEHPLPFEAVSLPHSPLRSTPALLDSPLKPGLFAPFCSDGAKSGSADKIFQVTRESTAQRASSPSPEQRSQRRSEDLEPPRKRARASPLQEEQPPLSAVA